MTKKVLTVFVFTALLAVPSLVLAQYGGGGSYSAPASPTLLPPINPADGKQLQESKLLINGGAKTSDSTRVTLILPVTNADQMAISNTSDFKNVSWEKYSATKEWILNSEPGMKTVYVFFRNSTSGGTTAVVSASIELLAAATANSPTKDATTRQNDAPGGTSNNVVVVKKYKFTKLLNVGSKGEEVRQLQIKLKAMGYYKAGVTGKFDKITKAAVVKFQKAKKLKPYPGWVGPGTRKVLNSL